MVDNIFNLDKKEKAAGAQKTAALKQTFNKVTGTNQNTRANLVNPFLNNNGMLFNPYLNYQKLLDDPNVSQVVKNYITQATGLLPTTSDDTYLSNPTAVTSSYGANTTVAPQSTSSGNSSYSQSSSDAPISSYSGKTYSGSANSGSVNFNPNLASNSLASLDVTTELPKLSTSQIEAIIKQHFGKSTVIQPSDAQGIYDAQQQTGMSALAILGIGALESGYGTSNIAKKKNNIWGWNATNSNPAGNAKSFSQMSQGAYEFANAYMKTYYNKYGAKSISDAGTGNNPAGKGYAYDDNGNISTSWATNVGNIMGKLYNTAKSVSDGTVTSTSQQATPSTTTGKLKAGSKVADISHSGYNNSAAKGQCVWYAKGRASEKLGVTLGSMGNGNEMWYNAKPEARLAATIENLKPNTLLSFKKGTSQAGQTAGHVIYIEDVVGDTVYYTEGGSGYYKNGTVGVVKTASRSDILNGVNSQGGRIGSGAIGLIDLSKYTSKPTTTDKTTTTKTNTTATTGTNKSAAPWSGPAIAEAFAPKSSSSNKTATTTTTNKNTSDTKKNTSATPQHLTSARNKSTTSNDKSDAKSRGKR